MTESDDLVPSPQELLLSMMLDSLGTKSEDELMQLITGVPEGLEKCFMCGLKSEAILYAEQHSEIEGEQIVLPDGTHTKLVSWGICFLCLRRMANEGLYGGHTH